MSEWHDYDDFIYDPEDDYDAWYSYGGIPISAVSPSFAHQQFHNPISDNNRLVSRMRTSMPELSERTAICPEFLADPGSDPCSGSTQALQYIIIHLNDEHRWTREQIADYLDKHHPDLEFPVPS